MIYLDNAATTLHKPPEVIAAVTEAMTSMGNSSRGTYNSSLIAARTVYTARTRLAALFGCKRADRVKILVWDASGLVLVWKQLQQGGFRWPPVMDGAMRLSAVEFAALFDGLDWTRVQTVRRIPTPTAAG